VISSDPPNALGSQTKLFTVDPSASVAVPIASGAGTSATNAPNASLPRAQTSTSIPSPAGSETRTNPGFGGVVFASANNR
jgi:hypothetical protein